MELMDMLHRRVCVPPVGNEAAIKTDKIKVEGGNDVAVYIYR